MRPIPGTGVGLFSLAMLSLVMLFFAGAFIPAGKLKAAEEIGKSGSLIKPKMLAGWVREPEARRVYQEALKDSSIEGMLNYYKANYPRPPYREGPGLPSVKCPVLVLHGLEDKAHLPGALNDTWKWVEKELTLVTTPGAGHFTHRDKPEWVTRKMVSWLDETGR